MHCVVVFAEASSFSDLGWAEKFGNLAKVRTGC